MSRPLLPQPGDAHLNMMHKSTDGTEMNASDLPLPAGAAAFTSAATLEQWLENLQLSINRLNAHAYANPAMTRLGTTNGEI